MMLARTARRRRRGLSLLEVLTALAIFLLSSIVISQLIDMGSARAVDADLRGQAALKCQSKLAELAVGALPLETQNDIPFDEDTTWTFSVTAEPGNVDGLYNVTVTVHKEGDATPTQAKFSRMIFDPAQRGSATDSATTTATTTTGTGAAAP